MQQNNVTQVGRMKVRRAAVLTAPEETPAVQPVIDWKQPVKRHPGERLMRNMAVAAALVVSAVSLRAGAIPTLSGATDAVLAAATEDTLLNDSLGRLSFVSAMFPEATQVFSVSTDLALPVSGGAVVHAWSEQEPYMTFRAAGRSVTSAASGEVMGVYHGNGDELLVQVMGADGLACVYGNLGEAFVMTGDAVAAGDVIGTLADNTDFVFEVRREGRSIDPALFLGGV